MKLASANQTTLYYVHDPMCSWCYAFRPLWQQILAELPEDIQVEYILGGLSPDSDQPMPNDLQHSLIKTWERIMTTVPGTTFNFDFWQQQKPRRSTYPACRAIIAARALDRDRENAMIYGIQDAYYQQAKNPSDTETLIDIAVGLGLDRAAFSQQLQAPATQQSLLQELAFARSIGGDSFPSLILKRPGESHHVLMLSYTDKTKILSQL